MEAGFDTLLQGGALAIFVWYTLQNNREWRTYLTERNSKLESAINKQAEAQIHLTDTLKKIHKI